MRIRGVPVLFALIALLGLAMAAPSASAALEGDWRSARQFLFSSAFTLFAAAICGLAARAPARDTPRAELLTLVGAYAVTPIFAGVPIYLLAPELGVSGAYFEALSSFSTTGATLLPAPEEHPRALHLWRALLGWMGGAVILAAAAAVLSPRSLAGPQFAESAGANVERVGRVLTLDPAAVRLRRAFDSVAPVYVGLTALLTLLLIVSGQPSFVALIHAMGTLSTSGISAIPGGVAGSPSHVAEAFMAIFMVLAAHRLLFSGRRLRGAPLKARSDPEFQLMAICVAVATAWLFLRHWLGAFAIATEGDAIDMLRALWGSLFTVISFVTTTGYASEDWISARDWSGLDSPALILIALAALGGGVASTAGGVKLYRAFALFSHSANELSRLTQPSLVAHRRLGRGGVGREGVTHAWIFMMLFVLTMAGVAMLLTLSGLDFEAAMIGAASALSNTGPALIVVTDNPGAYAEMPISARATLCAAMVLGRIEVMVVVALLNPSYWRK